MFKRMLIMLGCVAIAAGGIYHVFQRNMQAKMAQFKMMVQPPAAVSTLVAKPQTWQPVLSAVGSLKAVNGVLVSTDLAGIVSEIAFESGKPVKKGDLLLRLDTKQEEAQLAAAQARLDLAKVSLNRKKDLLEKKAASQADFDAAAAEARQAAAAADETRALIARKTITAPFDGILGIRQVNIGQYVNAGVAMVPLESSDPIYVEFSIPQPHLGEIGLQKKVRLTAAGLTGKTFEGEITAIDSRLDESNRNIQVEATVSNPKGSLRAGMFVKVDVLLPETSGVLAVPASSVSYTPYGDSVYLVKEGKNKDGKPEPQAVQQFIKLGPTRGDQVSVLSGIQEGDEIITSGAFKLRPNIPVKVNNTIQPGNEEHPQPPDT
ncbi:MAG: efflux RND transporter periplasmic adaptor subunit [Chthoniobacteraceae bacterium]|nr:efflux RND transporter periplasmic adaptor subunit [Chthoniobacteraceae bacterium]